MMVSNSGNIFALLHWQKRLVLHMVIAAAATAALHELLGYTWWRLPTVPLAVVGAALGIFVSFRTNSAYDRWWEGRKLWGRLINTSRHFASQVVAYVPDERAADRARLISRHAAYVHALRTGLRQHETFEDPDFRRSLPDEPGPLHAASNLNHELLHRQFSDLIALNKQGIVDDFRLQRLDSTLEHLLDIQGGCERIKKTPMPRGYGFIAERLIVYYSYLFPLAIVADLAWLAIPINVLVCLSFALISETGRVLEDPFNMFYNGLPLSQMSLMIERNIRECNGETELPEVPGVDDKGILM